MDRGAVSIYTIQQMDITEIQDELLRLEYPNLLPDHDPDIERYYYLRSIGQSRDAMAIYQNRLRVRYPEETFRTWLLRAYRSHDPSFRGLLARGYRMLGARSLERVAGVIQVIADLAESFNEKDVYSTIKTVESILKFLPQERYEAVAGMDRFARYANALNLRVKSIAKAAELVRAYLTDTLSIVEEERRRRSEAQRHMEDMERQRLVQADWDSYYYQKKFGFRPGLLDLSTVVFSPEDLARIEIPPLSRVEDQILAYCFKYWNAVEDPAFERILFLYSRKYGKKNYDVYTAIRRGHQARRRDDEILASIMSVLVTGYYYSIQGDLYLQRNWNILKSTLAQQKALPAPAPSSDKKTSVKRLEAKPAKQTKQIEDKRPGKTARKPAAKLKPVAKQKPAAKPKLAAAAASLKKTKPAALPKPRIIPKASPKSIFKIAPKPAKTVRPVAVVARQAGKSAAASLVTAKPVKVPYKLKQAQQTKTTIVARARPIAVRPAKPPVKKAVAEYKPAPYVTASAPPSRPKPKVFSNKTLGKAKGSVSDRLKALSGHSYDVYEDRFLSKARTSIRKILGAGKGLFFSLPEEAEDLVYNFLRDHYSDPYMDWENSTDRKNLLNMGFDLSSVHPVIDECYRAL